MTNNPYKPSQHDLTYSQMLTHILSTGDSHADRTGVGTTSVFGYQNRYDLAEGFPLLTTKRMAWRSIVVELAWFLLGRTDNQWLTDRGVTIWNEWATQEQCAKFGRKEGDLGPVYGHQWRSFGEADSAAYHITGTDQIATLCRDLAENPNSRRLIVTGWNPDEATKVALPPCHTLWQCKVRERRVGPVMESKDCETPHTVRYLDLHLYQRSADCFLGVPFNIASYSLLLQLLAHTHGLLPGQFIHTFGDLHIYNNHREQVKEQQDRVPFPAPSVLLPTDLRGTGFAGVIQWAAMVGQQAVAVNFRDTGSPVRLCNYQCHDAIKAAVAV
jgi:thymidylate synthase